VTARDAQTDEREALGARCHVVAALAVINHERESRATPRSTV
jgi:hypothetical protein